MTTEASDVLNPEKLATQEALSEEQTEQLHKDAIAMRENGGKEPEKKTEPGEVKETAPAPEKVEETQKTPEVLAKEKKDAEAKEAAALKEANDKLLKTPDDKLDDAGKAKKAILVRDKAEADLVEEATALVKESDNKVSIDDAKKEITQRNKLAEKYKGEPKQLAKALLHSQREFTKLQNENKALKEAPRPSQLKPGEAIIDGKLVPAEQVREILIEGYKDENPKLTEGLDDEKVYELAVANIKEKQKLATDTASKQLVLDAKEKRSKVLATLSDSEKEYAEEITNLVGETPDHVLMSEEWSFDDVKSWARGRYYTQERLNAVRQEGYKKGREEAEILGVKEIETRPGAKGTPPAPKTGAGSQLTEDQKERARAMYRTEGLTDAERFDMYADFLEHQKKNK